MIIVSKRKFLSKILILLICIIIAFFAVTPIKKLIYPLKHQDIITKYSEQYQLDPYLVMGVISSESRFVEAANSHKGAMGLMQLTEETATWCIEHFKLDVSIEDVYKPDVNIRIGCAYMSYLIEVFDGETGTAIAAYNAGQGNVKNWLSDKRYSDDGKTLDVIPFDETKEYVEKVMKRHEIYKDLY